MLIIEGANLKIWHMLTQKAALKLEIGGIKNSRGSVYAHIKRVYNLTGSREKVLEKFSALIEQESAKA